MTDSRVEVTTPLARSVLSGAFLRQHRDMIGEAPCVAMHIFAALPEDPGTEDVESDSDEDLGFDFDTIAQQV